MRSGFALRTTHDTNTGIIFIYIESIGCLEPGVASSATRELSASMRGPEENKLFVSALQASTTLS